MDEYGMIDTQDITNFLSAFVSFIKRIFHYIAASIKKYFVLAIIIFVAINGTGFFYWYSRQPVYESQMVCMFNSLGKKTHGEVIQQLDNLAKTHSYDALSKNLGLSLDQAKSIVSIDGRNMAGYPLYKDISSDRSPIYITVKSTDKAVFEPLQTALIAYLNNYSPFRKTNNEIEMKVINEKIEFMDKDIASIDSVIHSYSIFLKNVKSDSIAGFTNIATLFSYKEQLEEKETQLEWQKRETQQNIELLHGFLSPDYPSRGDSRKFFWKLFIYSLLAVCFIPVFCRLLKSDS
ncbi:MAG TPA: hypothetical protein VN721_12565 [Flavipsychrobacter sp.]|nr:hypothetical protein [Flavipsychrobacter sp.]